MPAPTNDTCANKRTVIGRRASGAGTLVQASLTPLAAGHASAEPSVAARAPFAANAPEATFSLEQARSAPDDGRSGENLPFAGEVKVPTLQSPPPSFREIRSGRAAAARRAPVAEVRIPLSEIAGESMQLAPARAQASLPGLDLTALRERVRQGVARQHPGTRSLTSA